MQLIRGYTPLSVFSPISELERELERFLGRAPGGAVTKAGAAEVAVPVTDVHEDDKQFTVTLELPGVKKEDVHVSLNDGLLEISAERREETSRTEGQYHRRERYYGRFARRFQLDVPVDAGAVKAAFKDGVLSVTVPKAVPAKAKAIEIVAE